MKRFKVIPKVTGDVKMMPVSTKVPYEDHKKMVRVAKKNGLNVLELAQQMLLHCLGEVDNDEDGRSPKKS